MIRSIVRSTCAIVLLVGTGSTVIAGDPIGRRVVPVVPGPGFAQPTAVAVPVPTAARSPYLGTFRPDPTLIMRSGFDTGGSYTPGGLPRAYGTMSLYGPFSRLRSIPEEVVTYSRGYDGVLRPTSAGISYEYTDPRLYPDTTLVPTGMRYNLYRGTRTPSGFGRYLLGQD